MPTSSRPDSEPASPRSRAGAWPSITTFAALAVGVVGLLVHSNLVMGIGITLLGLTCLGWAMASSNQEMHDRLRRTRGFGAPLGWLMSLAPGAGAKVLFVALSLAITALGVVAIIVR